MSFLSKLAGVLGDIFSISQGDASLVYGEKPPLYLHNTLTGRKQQFDSIKPGEVKMYNCGPTVYGPQHIGNLSMFVFVDILRRTLELNAYTVKQVINFTDVGHLTGDNEGDADEGEDKMTKGLKREGMALTLENMRALGEKYGAQFLEQLKALNIHTNGTTFPRASDYIKQQIEMVKILENKDVAYKASQGVYFDTSKFPEYGRLGNIDLSGIRAGARVSTSSDKRNPTDFLLWKFSGANMLGWDSPWGKGYPGWHIECSAMARDILGDQIDIHTGGIEHIPVHHNNEIAQSESATGKKPFSRFWLHRAHLQIEGQKIAKSAGKAVYLSDISAEGFPAIAFRYLLLGAHYRTPASFTWEGLKSAQTSLFRLYNLYDRFKEDAGAASSVHPQYKAKFVERINDDLDTPGALALMWDMVRDERVAAADKVGTLNVYDSVFALGLSEMRANSLAIDSLPSDVQNLIKEREAARAEKDWARADSLRKSVEHRGYTIEDSPYGPRVLRK